MMYGAFTVHHHGVNTVNLGHQFIVRHETLHQFGVCLAGVVVQTANEQSMGNAVPCST